MTVTRIKTTSLHRPTPKYIKKLRAILGPDWQAAYSFMLPAVLLMAGVIALPFFMAFFLSFTNTHIVGETGPFVGLRNYVVIWEDPYFRNSVWITAKYTFWTVLFKVIIGLLAALLLHRLKRFSAASLHDGGRFAHALRNLAAKPDRESGSFRASDTKHRVARCTVAVRSMLLGNGHGISIISDANATSRSP